MYKALCSVCSIGKTEGKEGERHGEQRKECFGTSLRVHWTKTPERTDPWRAGSSDPFPSLMAHTDDTGVEKPHGAPDASEPQYLASGSAYLAPAKKGCYSLCAAHRACLCRLSFQISISIYIAIFILAHTFPRPSEAQGCADEAPGLPVPKEQELPG